MKRSTRYILSAGLLTAMAFGLASPAVAGPSASTGDVGLVLPCPPQPNPGPIAGSEELCRVIGRVNNAYDAVSGSVVDVGLVLPCPPQPNPGPIAGSEELCRIIDRVIAQYDGLGGVSYRTAG